jgi:hypothetical protein
MLKDKTLHIVALPLLMLRSNNELGTHFHLFILWVDVVPDGHPTSEVNGGASVVILPAEKLGIKVSGCREIVITIHWLHDICD